MSRTSTKKTLSVAALTILIISVLSMSQPANLAYATRAEQIKPFQIEIFSRGDSPSQEPGTSNILIITQITGEMKIKDNGKYSFVRNSLSGEVFFIDFHGEVENKLILDKISLNKSERNDYTKLKLSSKFVDLQGKEGKLQAKIVLPNLRESFRDFDRIPIITDVDVNIENELNCFTASSNDPANDLAMKYRDRTEIKINQQTVQGILEVGCR